MPLAPGEGQGFAGNLKPRSVGEEVFFKEKIQIPVYVQKSMCIQNEKRNYNR